MRLFAKATVKDVESHFNFPRKSWDTAETLENDAVVQFLLEEPDGSDGGYIYHAFVDPRDPPVMFGSVKEIPKSWLSEEDIAFYFKASIEEFAKDDFLERYFSD